jgi:BolA protein
MNTKTRRDIIYDRLQHTYSPTYLEVTDDSDQHIGHVGHQGGQRHFTVVISAKCLLGLSRIAAHRKIYSLFEDMMPDQIHALRIKVITEDGSGNHGV